MTTITGPMGAYGVSWTTVAAFPAASPYANPVATTWEVSFTAVPAQVPKAALDILIRWPSTGYTNTAAVPNRVLVAIAKETSSSSAWITGAVAVIAVFPHTAVPTPIKVASRPGT